jgi:hypothetical protein
MKNLKAAKVTDAIVRDRDRSGYVTDAYTRVTEESVQVFEHNGCEYEAEISIRTIDTSKHIHYSLHKETLRKGRMYVGIDNNIVSELLGEEPAYSVRGEDEVSDKAWDSYNRSFVKLMKSFATESLAAGGVELPKVSFSRKAGCSMCPCSPGFILDETNLEIFLNVRYIGETAKLEIERAAQKAEWEIEKQTKEIAELEASIAEAQAKLAAIKVADTKSADDFAYSVMV